VKNRMADVRDHLVATLEALQDKDAPMDVARAKAVSDVAQTFINAVKVEVDARKLLQPTELPQAIAEKPLLTGPSR
jgi:hypothetical protein